MDYAIGQLLEALERTCQRENTLIVFSSDNGAINDCPIHGTDTYPGWQEAYPRLGSNLPLRGVKAQLYEGGIRTPTLVNWRSRLAPGKMEHAVHIADWMPSLVRLTESAAEEDPRWDGVDIWPLIAGERDKPDERCMYWNFRRATALGARLGEWKLIARQQEDGRAVELFNIAEDPHEKNDLALKYPAMVDQLLDQIEAQRQLDDSARRDDVDDP